MEYAIKKIEKYADSSNLSVTPVYIFSQKKAFERNLFEDNCIAKKSVKEISKKFKIPKSEHLGYDNSQSLIAFHNNTPNNTLGFIRYDTENYASLFPRRHDKKPDWQRMKKDRENRHKTNYNNKLRREMFE